MILRCRHCAVIPDNPFSVIMLNCRGQECQLNYTHEHVRECVYLYLSARPRSSVTFASPLRSASQVFHRRFMHELDMLRTNLFIIKRLRPIISNVKTYTMKTNEWIHYYFSLFCNIYCHSCICATTSWALFYCQLVEWEKRNKNKDVLNWFAHSQ